MQLLRTEEWKKTHGADSSFPGMLTTCVVDVKDDDGIEVVEVSDELLKEFELLQAVRPVGGTGRTWFFHYASVADALRREGYRLADKEK